MTGRRLPGLAACLALGLVAGPAPTAPAAAPGALPDEVFAPCAATTAAALRLPDEVFARPPGDDRVDVVLLGASRAAVVRLRVTIGTAGYRSAWREFVVRLHAYLDRDNDGTLTAAEANRAPWTNLLQSPFNGNRAPVQANSKPTQLDADRDGKVSVEELGGYLRGMQDHDALGVAGGPPPDVRTESVFKHLDRDGDRAVSASELAQCESFLGRFDRDEDELVELDELTPDRSTLADRFGGRNVQGPKPDPETSPIVAVGDDEARTRLAARIARTYGKPAAPGAPPTLAGPGALALSPAAFRAADRDGDGRLSAREVDGYLADPVPDVELAATLPNAAPGRGTPVRIEPVKGTGPPAAGLSVQVSPDGGFLLTFEGAEIELRAADSLNQFPDQFFEQQFQSADGDKNGYLDAREARGNFFLQRMFPVADRDGNGRLTLAELKLYNERNNDAVRNRTTLAVSDRGSSLHQRLDIDKDTRLSLRELRKARENLRPFDADGDGRITLAELPRRSLVTVGRNDRNGNNVVFTTTTMTQGGNGSAGNRPDWFVGMDRNRDGDVSPREFLGTPEQFRQFDADGDGLIDAQEAARTP